MFVRDRMSTQPVTVTPEMPFQDALQLMRQHGFRRLPVVNASGELVGIVSERDLLYASPSRAISLSVWELNYLLNRLKIQEIMTQEVFTTTPDDFIEDAARLMAEKKIGGLPVVDGARHVVGVITETDIFKTFIQMYRVGHAGLRLTLQVPDRKGVLAELTKAIFDLGGDILSASSFYDETIGKYSIVVKVKDVNEDQLVGTLEALGDHVVDAHKV